MAPSNYVDDLEFSLTHLLTKAQAGDKQAYSAVYERTYAELRQLAHHYMRTVPGSDTLQPTALVNEAYIRISNRQDLSPTNSREFFGIVSRAMRDIVVEQARKHGAQKRGAGWTKLHLDQLGATDSGGRVLSISPILLSASLEHLRQFDPDLEELVRLRFFGGLSLRAVAQLKECSVSRVRHDWSFAKAWLMRDLSSQIDDNIGDE